MTRSHGRAVSIATSSRALDTAASSVGVYALPSSGLKQTSGLTEYDAGSRPTVSVVICTRNRPNELRECLEHVCSLMPASDEVIVVDNSNGDYETEWLTRACGARYVVESSLGLSRARNRGMAESHCDVVAYLDDDCIPEADWLEHLLQPFYDERVAAAAGEIVRFKDRKTPLHTLRGTSAGMRYVSREMPYWFEIASFGGIGSGGNMAFRRSACCNSNIFDERLGRGAPLRIAEENCAFAELLAMGHAAVRISAACVYHPFRQRDAEQEAKSAIAYWLLLFSRFPKNRMDLLSFVFRRALRRPLVWRNASSSQDGIVSSGWSVKLRGAIAGFALFLHARRFIAESGHDTGTPVLTLISSGRQQAGSAWLH